MFKFIVSLLMVGLVGAVQAEPNNYDSTEVLLAKALAVSTIVDLGQTLDIADKCKGGGYYERNPFMSTCPSRTEVYRHFVGAAIITYVVSNTLTNEHRKVFLSSLLLLEVGMVANNYSIGLGVRF